MNYKPLFMSNYSRYEERLYKTINMIYSDPTYQAMVARRRKNKLRLINRSIEMYFDFEERISRDRERRNQRYQLKLKEYYHQQYLKKKLLAMKLAEAA